MATKLIVTLTGTVFNPFLTVSGFYGGAPSPIITLTPGEQAWVDINDPASGGGGTPISGLIVGGTVGGVTFGDSSAVTIPAPEPLATTCYEVDFIDMIGGQSLLVTANSRNLGGGAAVVPLSSNAAPGLPVGVAVAHNFWTLGSGGPGPSAGGIWTPGPCCVHEDNRIQTAQGEKIPIKQLCAGDRVIDMEGHVVPIAYNIKHDTPGRHFVKISKGALGKNTPETDLLVRAGHPILFEGQEKQVQDLVNEDTIMRVELDEAAHVYAPCTARRTFVMIEGVPVATWAEKAWENFVENSTIGQAMRWSKQ